MIVFVHVWRNGSIVFGSCGLENWLVELAEIIIVNKIVMKMQKRSGSCKEKKKIKTKVVPVSTGYMEWI